MIARQRAAISSSASSQVIGANLPSPLAPVRRSGVVEALRRVHQLGVAVDLGAGEAGGERLVGIALDAHDAAVLDLGQQRAHVGAIMRADDANRFHTRLLSRIAVARRKPAAIAATAVGAALSSV